MEAKNAAERPPASSQPDATAWTVLPGRQDSASAGQWINGIMGNLKDVIDNPLVLVAFTQPDTEEDEEDEEDEEVEEEEENTTQKVAKVISAAATEAADAAEATAVEAAVVQIETAILDLEATPEELENVKDMAEILNLL